jgi:hypothetical protein
MINNEVNKMREIHNTLNKIFVYANETADFLEHKQIDHQLQYIAGNYIKIDDAYELQAYPMPVILIKGKGEIGFNLDGIYFEFVMKKDTAMRLDIEAFSKDYEFELYGAEDTEQSYYKSGMSRDSFTNGIQKSKEKGFGIAFNFEEAIEPAEKLYETFDQCFKRIIAGK